jgi:hypothetical protein
LVFRKTLYRLCFFLFVPDPLLSTRCDKNVPKVDTNNIIMEGDPITWSKVSSKGNTFSFSANAKNHWREFALSSVEGLWDRFPISLPLPCFIIIILPGHFPVHGHRGALKIWDKCQRRCGYIKQSRREK